MASPAAGCGTPSAPRDEAESVEPNQPEPACQEAQKWIEAVTGKRFGDKDFRSALENGILLCELLSAIKPGLVKKINRLHTPIAGLDNLSVFLRGCEELGLKGAQLFDPGDLQDTSIRANLKDSDCSRKLKNVLNTVFWLGKAASGCASYSGPTLNLKEFEGLLAQMKLESDEGGDSLQNRSVRDSGYDCWDSERSESLSPPRHTRDNSLDSLDSFGSRSQHSPSPDVVNRGNSDGRGSDSEADGHNKKPDVRKDDMLARRTVSSDSRSSVPFNQFLPNRTNASSYIPAPRRKLHTEDGEQRSHPEAVPGQCEGKKQGPHYKTPKTVTWAPDGNVDHKDLTKREEDEVSQEVLEQRKLQKLQKAGIKVLPAAVRYSSPPSLEEQKPKLPSPNIILRRDNDFLKTEKAAWDSFSDGEEEGELQKVPDVRKDDLASRRAAHGLVIPKVHQFIPPPVCSSKDRERWEGIIRSSRHTLQGKESSKKEAVPDIIRRRDNPFLNSTPHHEHEADEEAEAEEDKAVPNKQKDDLALRRVQSQPVRHRDGAASFVSASMSQADMETWERLRIPEPSEASQAPVCQACLEKNCGSSSSATAKSKQGHSKVVTFGGVTEIEQPVDTAASYEGEETELLRRLLAKATVAMPTIGLGSQLSEREHSQEDGADFNQIAAPSLWSPEAPHGRAELDARLDQWEKTPEEEEEEERLPDIQKDDMMTRRLGAFNKMSSITAVYKRFLPLPASKCCAEVEDTADGAQRNKITSQAGRNENLTIRVEKMQSRVLMEAPEQHPEVVVGQPLCLTECKEQEDEEYNENGPVPDLEKDDMMARRTGSLQKPSSTGSASQSFNQFLPVPGSVKYKVSPVSRMKQLRSRSNVSKKTAYVGDTGTEVVRPRAATRECVGVTEEQKEEDWKQRGDVTIPATSFTDVIEPQAAPSLTPPPGPAVPQPPTAEVEQAEQSVEEKVDDRNRQSNKQQHWQPLWLEDDRLPPMMMSRRVAFMSEDNESASMSDIVNEEEVHTHPMSQSRFERMHKQHNTGDEDDQWQDDLARWKSRRRSASQELIKKEEERKRMEKRMKEGGSGGNKRKSIKTYKEIVEEKERREAELCEAYRRATTPEEAAMVLQHYALRFTISDATLDSLKLPRSTTKPKLDQSLEERHKPPAPAVHSETSDLLYKPESTFHSKQMDNPEEAEPHRATLQEPSPVRDSPPSPVTPLENMPLQSPELNEPHVLKEQIKADAQPKTKRTPPQIAQVQPYTTQAAHVCSSAPPAPSRPVPLLAAKPYCQPVSTNPAHKPVKIDGLVRMNGEETEDKSVSASLPHSPEGSRDVSCEEKQARAQQSPPLQTGKVTSSSSSAISSLIGGRNCVIRTTIVTELTQTHLEPHPLDVQNNRQVNGGTSVNLVEENVSPATSPNTIQDCSPTVTEGLEESSLTIETPMLNLAKRVNHWVWDPNEERKRLERWQQEQERLLQEQYQREQEKLKKEWERAQLEVEEEERKHNEEERRILEETVTPLNPSGLFNQQLSLTVTATQENKNPESGNVPLQQNGRTISVGNEDQPASKLHYFQEFSRTIEPSKKQELWKTASLDRNPQTTQPSTVKRSGSHDVVMSTQTSSSTTPQPPSPSRCVSGKRLCSGCSQPLGKGAAMIVDTVGLFFHMQCFKCGVCNGQLGDATVGTDVRIRNGLLSCHECYIASRGRGQPTTL
ncbi:LIM and calponin homology domains-containing protein 1a isoform X2 [Thalassophryne amazonica]|uniref:LIM and calponin homology domains-containing protein 1a isoform X2 n=1 Tax=Thalassophryne amazonica TaxID=390379 RepID=UPI001471DDD5|nr:LIM and calponin homology domains-containing protein 1a isoform X2 [Thalassophryne amazonica]